MDYKSHRRWLMILPYGIAVAFGLVGFVVAGIVAPNYSSTEQWTVAIGAAVVSYTVAQMLLVSGGSFEISGIKLSFDSLKAAETAAADELKVSSPDFGTLWSVTQDRIDYYHQIATSQARRSFISSQIATGAGFVLIIVVGIIASQATSPIAAISAGAVGIVGGGLSAYIGATFMKSQAEASAQLRQFFMQPVEFSRILGAERLLENLEPEQRSEAVHQIIRSMMFTQNYGEEKKEP